MQGAKAAELRDKVLPTMQNAEMLKLLQEGKVKEYDVASQGFNMPAAHDKARKRALKQKAVPKTGAKRRGSAGKASLKNAPSTITAARVGLSASLATCMRQTFGDTQHGCLEDETGASIMAQVNSKQECK